MPLPAQTTAPTAQRTAPADSPSLFRTRIVIDSPARRARLDDLGIVVLEETADRGEQTANGSDAVSGPWSAVVLVDDEQLETLARLCYLPQASDEFVSLVETGTSENSWLAAGVAPLLAVDRTVSAIGDCRTTSPTYETGLLFRYKVNSAWLVLAGGVIGVVVGWGG